METLSVTGNPSPGGPGGSPRLAPLTDRPAPRAAQGSWSREPEALRAPGRRRGRAGPAAAVIDGADAQRAREETGPGGGRSGDAPRRKGEAGVGGGKRGRRRGGGRLRGVPGGRAETGAGSLEWVGGGGRNFGEPVAGSAGGPRPTPGHHAPRRTRFGEGGRVYPELAGGMGTFGRSRTPLKDLAFPADRALPPPPGLGPERSSRERGREEGREAGGLWQGPRADAPESDASGRTPPFLPLLPRPTAPRTHPPGPRALGPGPAGTQT